MLDIYCSTLGKFLKYEVDERRKNIIHILRRKNCQLIHAPDFESENANDKIYFIL